MQQQGTPRCGVALRSKVEALCHYELGWGILRALGTLQRSILRRGIARSPFPEWEHEKLLFSRPLMGSYPKV